LSQKELVTNWSPDFRSMPKLTARVGFIRSMGEQMYPSFHVQQFWTLQAKANEIVASHCSAEAWSCRGAGRPDSCNARLRPWSSDVKTPVLGSPVQER